MTTQYTPILKLALPVTGELSGTWGTVVNDNITSMVEQAVAGLSTINTWTSDAHTLTTADGTSSESRCAMLVAQNGAGLTGAGTITCPAASKLYVLKNATSHSITLKASGTINAGSFVVGFTYTISSVGTTDFQLIGASANTIGVSFTATGAGTGDGTATDAGVAVPAGDTAFLFCNGTSVNACVTTIVNGHISGNLTVDGNTTLGNATSDTITATARFNTDLLPSTDNARDLGSTANSWRTLYCDTSVLTPLVTATNLQVTNIKANDGTAVAVLTDSTGATDFSKAFTLSAIAQNISLGASQTTGTFVLGGTAATGAITLDASTKAHTLNIGTGATESAATKTINFGTAGVSGSTTTIAIGSAAGATGLTINAVSTITPVARTSGAASYFTLTTPADTNQTASTEAIGASFTAATRTWANGNITTQRERVFAAPTYAFFSAPNSTITTAINVDIATPDAGTNATITNAYALRAGASIFTGNVTLDGGTANGVVYLNASKVATTGSALSFDGTNLAFGTVGAKINFATTGSATQNYVGVAADGFSLELTTQRGVIQPITYKQDYSAGHVWEVAGGEKMRLAGATGGVGALGIGYTSLTSVGDSGLAVLGNVGIGTNAPTQKLTVNSGATTTAAQFTSTGSSVFLGLTNSGASAFIGADSAGSFIVQTPGSSYSTKLTVDISGNLGLGVTPKTDWSTDYKAMQFGASGALSSLTSTSLNFTVLATNQYVNSAGTSKFINDGYAPRYLLRGDTGEHYWYTTNTSTAGQTVSNTQAMTLDASGNLGVGTTSPDAKLDVTVASGLAAIFGSESAANAYTGWKYNSTTLGYVGNGSGVNGGSGATDFGIGSTGSRALTFGTNDTERARITSGGDLLVGTNTALNGTARLDVNALTGNNVAATLKNDAGANQWTAQVWNAGTSGDNAFIQFATETAYTGRGSITYNRGGGLVAYNTTSDYRAKDIRGPVTNTGATIDALKVYNGKMKGATVERPMLIAHEAQAVTPYAVTGEKDAVDEDGKPKYQQMDVSSLVPLLIAEIQSLRARVAQLEQGA